MSLTAADLVFLVERASRLDERFSGEFVPLKGGEHLAQSRLALWKSRAASGDAAKFTAIVQATNGRAVSDADLSALLGPVKRVPGLALPEWAIFLGAMTNGVAQRFAQTKSTDHKAGRHELPFQELHTAISEFAWSQVEAYFPSAATQPPAVRLGLQAHLQRRVSNIISVPLHTLFLAHQAYGKPGKLARLPHDDHPTATKPRLKANYRGFVLAQGKAGLSRFFRHYPVAARLVATVTLFWVEFTSEFLRRLERDRSTLALHFTANEPLGNVIAIQAGMSDPHQGGKTVIIVSFQQGLKLVYKPRSMAVDALFFDLVRFVNSSGRNLGLRVLKVLDQGDYGWMEFAEHLPCENQRAVRRFYRRAGALACLVDKLHGVDCHRENLVAAGDQPVLVDLEALAHPVEKDEVISDVLQDSSWDWSHSPLRSGFLPYWKPGPSGTSLFDNSALGAPVRQAPLVAKIRWRCINTDQMEWHMVKSTHRHSEHRPRLGKALLTVQAYRTEVFTGYLATRELLERQGSLLGSLLKRIRETPRRRIKRATLIYGIMHRRSLRPEQLEDGVDRSLSFQALSCEAKSAGERAEEIRSLEALDIPYLCVTKGPHFPWFAATDQLQPGGSRQWADILRASLRRKIVLQDGRLWHLDAWRNKHASQKGTA